MPDARAYRISDTTLEASWVDTGGFHGAKKCTNCGHTISLQYQQSYAELGKFCPNCGFKMTNPGAIIVEYDYDD